MRKRRAANKDAPRMPHFGFGQTDDEEMALAEPWRRMVAVFLNGALWLAAAFAAQYWPSQSVLVWLGLNVFEQIIAVALVCVPLAAVWVLIGETVGRERNGVWSFGVCNVLMWVLLKTAPLSVVVSVAHHPIVVHMVHQLPWLVLWYQAVCVWQHRQTWGKKIMGIRVIGHGGDTMTWTALFVWREAVWVGVLWLLGMMWVNEALNVPYLLDLMKHGRYVVWAQYLWDWGMMPVLVSVGIGVLTVFYGGNEHRSVQDMLAKSVVIRWRVSRRI